MKENGFIGLISAAVVFTAAGGWLVKDQGYEPFIVVVQSAVLLYFACRNFVSETSNGIVVSNPGNNRSVHALSVGMSQDPNIDLKLEEIGIKFLTAFTVIELLDLKKEVEPIREISSKAELLYEKICLAIEYARRTDSKGSLGKLITVLLISIIRLHLLFVIIIKDVLIANLIILVLSLIMFKPLLEFILSLFNRN